MAAALRQLLRLNSRRISGSIGCAAARPGAAAPPPPAALGFRTYTGNARPRYGVDDTTSLAVMRFLMTDKLGRRILQFPIDFTIALGFACILHSVIFGQQNQKNPAAAAGSSTDHRHNNSVRSV